MIAHKTSLKRLFERSIQICLNPNFYIIIICLKLIVSI